ncbi:MAG TPA: Clp protease N-terminal domain-containing protein [Candidatus Angelobacter sp.]|jgi:ATP-dependent Clp protease ATP-binding subunit ClpC
MFERYRQDARRAIFFARWEAQQSRSAYIEPEHLLLSLTHDADSKANQLFSLSAQAESFRKQLKPQSSTKLSPSVDLPLSNTGKRVLTYAAQEADRLASKPIGTEHLLLGLLREKSSDVLAALAAVGIDIHSARNRIREDRGLPTLDREPDGKEIPLKSLRPFAALALLVVVLSLIYLIMRLAVF